ncbi:MAG: ribosome maturation factor RimM [Syntrophales bacterium]|nr:ribosome maturation factor RimM [Syntrophales bacterium]MDD5643707.1 ribosome maturation factor RimM [Syntrophales bacterium]
MNKEGKAAPVSVGLGRLTGVHGLRGALKLRPDANSATTDPEVITALGEVEVEGRPHRVLDAGRLKGQILLRLEGIETRDQAETLIGQQVKGDASRFPPLPEGEYYWFQILGLPVLRETDGDLLGHLREIIPTPGHDVYVVHLGEKELLLPAVEGVITEINLAEGWIKAAPPPGL